MRDRFCVCVFLYAKEGKEQVFLEYENAVLPILKEYEGELLLRIRPGNSSSSDSKIRTPEEIHLIGFSEEKNFRDFLSDPKRKSLEEMKEESVLFSIPFTGAEISISESFYLNNG